MLFITAGMGKGTGTGASPVVARIAHDMGILTIAVVTYPYKLEQKKCCQKADEGIAELRKYVDSLIIIQNQKVMETYRRETLPVALAHADDVLKNAVKCIAELITVAGYQNVDFNDVVSILKGSGEAMLGLAEASGENRIEEVISKAMTCNLIDDNHITDAQNFLFFLRYGEDQELTVDELFKLSEEFEKYQNEDTHVIWGHAADKGLGDKLKLSVIITKYNKNTLTPKVPEEEADKQRDFFIPIPPAVPETPAVPEQKPEDSVVLPATDPTLFDTIPSEEAPKSEDIAPVPESIIAPVVEDIVENKEDKIEEKKEDPFGSQFFQQPNVPAVQMPSLVTEDKTGEYTALPHASHASQPKMAPAPAPTGIIVTDNGETDYDDDQKFNNLVNRPAWQTAIQDSRIVDVQTPSMQKTVQPEYTSQSVFFGLVGGANAD